VTIPVDGETDDPPTTARRRRRNPHSHQSILAATSELLGEVGYTALTMEGVAARAGVGKATVYRWWPTKGALVVETLSAQLPAPEPIDTGELRQDLLTAIRRAVQILAVGPAAAVIPALAADLSSDPAMAEQFRAQIIRPRRTVVLEVLQRATRTGELPADVDTELLLDIYAGAVFYRVLVSGEPVTDGLAVQLVNLLIDGKTPVTRPDGHADSAH